MPIVDAERATARAIEGRETQTEVDSAFVALQAAQTSLRKALYAAAGWEMLNGRDAESFHAAMQYMTEYDVTNVKLAGLLEHVFKQRTQRLR